MAYPPAYTRTFSFTDYEVNFPGEPKPGDELDNEYDNVSNALTATQANLALIQRADGELANDSVGADQLEDGIFDGIADGITADAEAAAAAAEASATAAASSAAAASTSAASAAVSDANAAGAAAQAGVSQGIAQGAAVNADTSADDAQDAATAAANSANEAQGFRNEASLHEETAFDWAEKLEGPVMPAPPGWPEAVDDGMFSSKWWAIRARDFNSTDTIDLGPGGESDIGVAFDNWDAIPGNDIGIGQTFATWGTPASLVPPHTFILIDRDNPSDPASWTDITGGPGPPGPANTLTVGTIATGSPGTPVTVILTGTSPNQVLNMTIPQGDVGPQGPQGIQGIPGTNGTINTANPTALIGLTAVNGVSTDAIRADGAPALSQAIAPTWTGTHTFTLPVRAADGSAAAPSYTFTSDTDTGVYLFATDRIGFTAGGGVRVTISNTALNSNVQALFADGSGASPGYSFANDPDTGLTRPAPDVLDIASGGVSRFRITNAAVSSFVPFAIVDGSAASPGLQFINDPDTGIFRNGADQIGLSTAGTLRLNVSTTEVVSRLPIMVPSGSAGAPTYTFEPDSNTGLWSPGGDEIGFAVAGAQVSRFSANNVSFQSLRVLFPDGTAALPSVAFQNDSDTGMRLAGGNTIGFSTAGVHRFAIESNGKLSSVVPTDTPNAEFNGATGAVRVYGDFGTQSYIQALNIVGGAFRVLNIDASATQFNQGPVLATGFQVVSSRAVKRETGKVTRAADVLSRLRPILYRLLAGDDKEQLGLIAEEVHEVCPLLSDGKSVMYDRLALLLLADWQERHTEAV